MFLSLYQSGWVGGGEILQTLLSLCLEETPILQTAIILQTCDSSERAASAKLSPHLHPSGTVKRYEATGCSSYILLCVY